MRNAVIAGLAVMGLSACAALAGPTVLQIPGSRLEESGRGLAWSDAEEAGLQAEFAKRIERQLKGKTLHAAQDHLGAQGFTCESKSVSTGYRIPPLHCEAAFATRPCQMDWTVLLFPNNGKVDRTQATFERVCVGDRDAPPRPDLAPPPADFGGPALVALPALGALSLSTEGDPDATSRAFAATVAARYPARVALADVRADLAANGFSCQDLAPVEARVPYTVTTCQRQSMVSNCGNIFTVRLETADGASLAAAPAGFERLCLGAAAPHGQ